jgi:site-specific DNA-cytosine methylase
VLSLFPGIDLMGRGFEQEGYCVVRGPDLIFGGDVRAFHPPPGRFDGIIGGSPCQDFSTARRCPPTGYGVEMLHEFCRCVADLTCGPTSADYLSDGSDIFNSGAMAISSCYVVTLGSL